MSYEEIFERFKFNCAHFPEKSAEFVVRLTAAGFEVPLLQVIHAVSVVHAMNAARGQWEKNDPPKAPESQYDESVIKARESDPSLLEKWKQLALDGRFVEATKEYRVLKGCGVKESYDSVQNWLRMPI